MYKDWGGGGEHIIVCVGEGELRIGGPMAHPKVYKTTPLYIRVLAGLSKLLFIDVTSE